MIDKMKVASIVDETLRGSEQYVVSMKITTDNRIFIDIDGDNGINVDDCIALSRAVENSLNRDEEDFELTVSSAGADSPLKLPRQYKSRIGRELEVATFDGEKVRGELKEVTEEQIVLQPKATRKVVPEAVSLKFGDIKVAKVVITF